MFWGLKEGKTKQHTDRYVLQSETGDDEGQSGGKGMIKDEG